MINWRQSSVELSVRSALKTVDVPSCGEVLLTPESLGQSYIEESTHILEIIRILFHATQCDGQTNRATTNTALS